MSISKLYGDIPNSYYSNGLNGAKTAESIVFGSSCTEIGDAAFRGNNSFINQPYKGLIGPLIIPDSVITVGVGAFQNCSGFTSLTLGKNVETLKAEAFRSCAGLTGSLIIPASVTSIGSGVFYNCNSLETLYIEVPAEAWVNQDYPVGKNFFSTPALTNIYVPAALISGYNTQWRIDQAVSGSVVISEWVGYHQAPVITQIETITFEKEETISLQVVATDPEAGVLTYSAEGLPNGLSIDPVTGLISGTISAGAEYLAPFFVTVTVVDNGSPNRSHNISFYMFGPKLFNVAPTITTLTPDQASFVADVISLQVLAVDSDAPLTYSAEGLPAGLSIDPATGLISGTISAGAEALSPYATAVTVTDSGSPLIRSNDFFFNWEVFPEVIPENTYFFDNPSKTFPELFQKVGPISDFEYQDNDDIISVTFGNSCTSIGYYAFLNCSSFGSAGTMIEIGGGITTIGDNAFYSTAVTQVAILNNVKTIGSSLFYGQMGRQGSALFIDTPASSWKGSAFGFFDSPTLYIRDIYRHGYDTVWAVTQGYNASYSLGILNWDNYPEYIPNAVGGNQFPDIEQIPTQLSLEEDVISLQVVATDPDNVDEPIDILTYSATGLPAGLSIDPATGLISGTTVLGAEASSPYEVLITVSDDGDPITTKNMLFIWNVTGENTAPTITTIPEQENEELDVVSLQVNAIDAQGHNLIYSATGLPAGLSIDPSTGLISGAINVGAEATGPLRTIVTVTDDGDPIESSEEAFNWYVPVRPTSSTAYNYFGTPVGTVATDIPPAWKNSIGAYNIYSIEIGTACTSIGGSSFSFCYNLGGDVVIPSNVTSIGSYAFSYGTSVNNYYLDVSASVFQASFAQTWVASSTSSSRLHVSPEHLSGYTQGWADNNRWFGQILEWQNYPNPIPNPNIAPVLSPIDDQTNYEVDDFVSLYFNGTDAGGGTFLTYAIVEPAEGLFPTLGLFFDSYQGRVYGNIKEGAASGSPYTIIVKCTDNGVPQLDSEPVEFTWTVEVPNQAPVLDPISTQNSEELDVISLQITYTDLENNNITFSATGLPTGLSIDPVTGLISGTISAGAEGSNPYVATITITDDGIPVKGDSLVLIWTVGSVLAENELNRYYDASGTLINAFEGVIPSGLGSDPNRINGDTSLVSLEIGSTCTSIQGSAFRDCINLNSPLIIGDGIENSISNIGSFAFYNCGALTGPVVIGSSVTAIGGSAFAFSTTNKRPRIDEMYVDVPSVIWGTDTGSFTYTFGGLFSTSYDSMVIYVSPTYFGIGTNYDAYWRNVTKLNNAVQIVNWDNYPVATPNV